MTQIQIDWSRAQETKRHNVASEEQARNELGETIRHNVVGENETHRHNVAGEKENKRHDKATEKETNRHNVRTEKQTDKQLKEQHRHNVRTESLTEEDIQEKKRHNKKTEKQQDKRIAAEAKKWNAEIANLNSRTIAQDFANSIDMQNPSMYTANRFVKVFDKRNIGALAYAGVKATDSVFRDAITGTASADEGVKWVDLKFYKKHGRHLSADEKQNWKHAIVEAANAWTDTLAGGPATAEKPKPVRIHNK